MNNAIILDNELIFHFPVKDFNHFMNTNETRAGSRRPQGLVRGNAKAPIDQCKNSRSRRAPICMPQAA